MPRPLFRCVLAFAPILIAACAKPTSVPAVAATAVVPLPSLRRPSLDDTSPRNVLHARACEPPGDVDRGMARAEIGCMVRVPGGGFLRGAQKSDPKAPNYDPLAADDEAPVRRITVKPFWLDRTEVSAARFLACVTGGGCRAEDASGLPRLRERAHAGTLAPAVEVSWRGAHDYCEWIGGRLPTEAEWEFAARGSDGRTYPWGNLPGPDCAHAVMNDGGDGGCGVGHPHEVRTMKGGNPQLGIAALAGNVWEWVADWYDAGYYARAPESNPTGPETGTRKVQRGGAWTSREAKELRAAARSGPEPDLMLDDVGFRCAADDVTAWAFAAGPAGRGDGASPYAGRYRFVLSLVKGGVRDQHEGEIVVHGDGSIFVPGSLEGRLSPEGRAVALASDALIEATCPTPERCSGTARGLLDDTTGEVTLTRVR